MDKNLRLIAAPFVLGAAGLMLMIGAMAATDTTPRAHALTNCTVSDFSLDSEEMAFLTLINNYRQQHGRGPLTISTNLNRAAHWMAWDLGTTPNWSHTDSLGRSPHQRAIDCGYPQGAGENLAAGTSWSTAQSAFNAWQNSTGHNANMLNQHYRQIGIARVHVQGSPYGWYWVTNFGATDDGTGGGTSPQPTSTPTPVPPTNTPVPPTNTPVPPTATPTTPPSQGFTPPTSTPTPRPTATPTTPSSQGFTPPTATPTAKPNNPAPTPTPKAGSLSLQAGNNLVGWSGQTASPEVALKDMKDDIRIVYGWNAQTQKWERYAPDLPGWASSLQTMVNGKGYWIVKK
jgi:uncharacterized protein YkwD